MSGQCMYTLEWVRPCSGSELLGSNSITHSAIYISIVTQCMCSLARVRLARSVLEFLDPSTVTNCEAQVCHRNTARRQGTLTVNISETIADINKRTTALENIEKNEQLLEIAAL